VEIHSSGVDMSKIETSLLPRVSGNAPRTRGFTAIAAEIRSQVGKSHIRFLIAGCFNTCLTFVIYVTGILLGINYMIANSFAWTIGVIVSFLLNSKFVFRKAYKHKIFLMFALSNVFSLVISMAMLSLMIKACSLNPILASVITIPVVVAISFLVSKFLVFR
jgi:putative flippase GtrA